MTPEKNQIIPFKEVVRPPLWLLAFLFFLLSSLALSLWAAFGNPTGIVSLGLGVVSVFIIARSMAMTISVDSGELKVGQAHIALAYLGQVRELSIDEMRLTRGRDADPAAFLALRFWQPHGVKMEIKDDRDPAPYWLISSKNASGLTKALQGN